jgi:outer membrane protein OmpA-like peptidoglycan-associated protein
MGTNMARKLLLFPAFLLAACSGMRLSQADKAYERMAYATAAGRYEKVFAAASHPERERQLRPAMLKAADAFRRNHVLSSAAAYYRRAAASGELDAETAFHYGEVLLALGEREKAAEQFMNVLAVRPEHRAAQDLLASCGPNDDLFADSGRYAISELPVQGVAAAFAAVPFRDGIEITGEPVGGMDRANPWNGKGFLDLFFVKKHTAVTWEPARALPGEVNGTYHDGPAVFSPDGRTIYFTRSNYLNGKLGKDGRNVSHLKLFRATLDARGNWTDLHAFGHNGEDFSTGHAALSADGRTLYFASDRPGSLGGSDIWRCVNNGTGWGQPENLGPVINTPGEELFPTVSGDALYFSSTAHRNLGGLDVFMTKNTASGWSPPVNMGYPVNTTRDDLAFVLNADGKTGYLSSDRSGTDRVYQFFIQEPILWVEGNVFGEPEGGLLPNAAVTLTNLLTAEDTSYITTDDGHFKFRLAPNVPYELQAVLAGRMAEKRIVNTSGMASGTTLTEDFHLLRAEVDVRFALENIYFDYDMWDIRPDAAVELDKLVRIIEANPNLTFELGAHTDSRGGDLYNLVLSDARARSAEDYLIRSGVDPQRLTAKGFGEEILVNGCADGVPCSEEQHQANRRVEVRISSVKEMAQR